MGAFAVGAASLMGIPLTAGFLSKWRLLEASLAAGQIWMVVVIAASSLLALGYAGRMIEAMFFRTGSPGAERAKEAPLGVLVPLWILAGLCVWFGIDASLPESLAANGAQALMGMWP